MEGQSLHIWRGQRSGKEPADMMYGTMEIVLLHHFDGTMTLYDTAKNFLLRIRRTKKIPWKHQSDWPK